MFRSIAAAGALLLTAAGPTVAGSAGPAAGAAVASAAITVTGPATAPYYSLATLSGTTAAASAPVTVLMRSARETTFHTFRKLTSDARGYFSTTVRIVGGFEYYAESGSAKSLARSLALPHVTCTTSRTLFRTPAIPSPNFGEPSTGFLTAQSGSYFAGVVDREPNIALYRWSPGHSPVVVKTLVYPDDQYGEPDTVAYTAVTPHQHNVVASVQRPGTTTDQRKMVGYVIRGNKPYLLASAARWASFEVSGVGPDGSVYGRAREGNDFSHTGAQLRYADVRWNEAGTSYRYLTAFGPDVHAPVVDGAGDYTGLPDGLVHRPDGGTTQLGGDGGELQIGTPHGFAGITENIQAVQWTVTAHSVAEPVLRTAPHDTYQVLAVDTRANLLANGTLAGGGQRNFLITAKGAVVGTPQQQYLGDESNVLDPDRGVAFTDDTGAVRFFHCT